MKYTNIKEFVSVKLGEIDAYIFPMKIKDVLPIYYVAVRGRDNVEGAVQRVLNKRRISSIKNFVLEGNMFFNSFILNWVDKTILSNSRIMGYIYLRFLLELKS